MKKLYLIQWGKERSIVKEFYTDNKEVNYLIVNNEYLMYLDEMGVIVWI